MAATKQIELHLNCLVRGNIWNVQKRNFHFKGIWRAILQLLMIVKLKSFEDITVMEHARFRARLRIISIITILINLIM